MAQFSVKTNNVRTTIDAESNLVRELESLEREIRNARNSLGFQVASKANIRNRLNVTANKVSEHKSSMNGMNVALQNVVSRYERAENMNIGNMNVGNVKIQNATEIGYESSGYSEGTKENQKPKDLDWLWKVTGVFGAGGKGISMIGKFMTSDKEPAAKWSGLFSDIWKTGWKVADTVKTCKKHTDISWWSAFFGTNKNTFLKNIQDAKLDWKTKASHGWNKGIKGTLREFKTAGGLVKQVGAITLSGITNAVSNYKEYVESNGKMSVGRAVAETFTETAVDWGKDLLIGAAVTAGFAAAGVAAQVFVVGLATVALSAGADWISEKLTGKKLTEAVSDFVLDKVETGAKKVKEKVTTLWNGICKGWSTLTGGGKTLQAAW